MSGNKFYQQSQIPDSDERPKCHNPEHSHDPMLWLALNDCVFFQCLLPLLSSLLKLHIHTRKSHRNEKDQDDYIRNIMLLCAIGGYEESSQTQQQFGAFYSACNYEQKSSELGSSQEAHQAEEKAHYAEQPRSLFQCCFCITSGCSIKPLDTHHIAVKACAINKGKQWLSQQWQNEGANIVKDASSLQACSSPSVVNSNDAKGGSTEQAPEKIRKKQWGEFLLQLRHDCTNTHARQRIGSEQECIQRVPITKQAEWQKEVCENSARKLEYGQRHR
jgi:hypothetical protein